MKHKRSSVLIAEADRAVAQDLRAQMERAGFTVFVARDGEQAAILAGRQRFDLLIVDLELAKMNGAELCRHVREDLRLTEVPIAVCSTTGLQSDAEALVFSYGISQIFYKPLNTTTVVEFARETLQCLVAAH